MAERSTAAVDVAETGGADGAEPAARGDRTTGDGGTHRQSHSSERPGDHETGAEQNSAQPTSSGEEPGRARAVTRSEQPAVAESRHRTEPPADSRTPGAPDSPAATSADSEPAEDPDATEDPDNTGSAGNTGTADQAEGTEGTEGTEGAEDVSETEGAGNAEHSEHAEHGEHGEHSDSAAEPADPNNPNDPNIPSEADETTAPDETEAGARSAETGRTGATGATGAAENTAAAADSSPGDGEAPSHRTTHTDEAGAAETPAEPPAGDTTGETPIPDPPELHSGHKLSRRYRLEECLTRLDGFSSWRAVDEKLRRAVGAHLLSAEHPRGRRVLSAARSTALLGDPRFVQVLDAVEDNGLIQIVHEWLPDATPLSELLASGPLEAHEAYQLVSQLSQALSAAHREGLSHLRLNPTTVLRTGMGQYRIRGLAVNAALRGVTSSHPQRTDTEAIGALLYAALTQRWPYDEDAYGLPGVGTLAKGTLVAPDQVRAGVHRGLSELAMRALVNDGATASRQEQPCATPEELAKAVSTMPRVRPPEPTYTASPPYHRTTFQQGAYGPGSTPAAGGGAGRGGEPPAPPTLPGRTGRALKWGVSALLIAALGLGSWQIADALLKGDPPASSDSNGGSGQQKEPAGEPVEISDAKDFDPEGSDGGENPEGVQDAIDGKSDTYWLTSKYYGQPNFGNLKSGVGLILDLGKQQQVSEVKVDFMGKTSVDFRAAPKSATGMPNSLKGFNKVTSGSGEEVALKAKKPVTTQYVLVWLTELPLTENGDYRGRVTEIEVSS